jgi:uncharacterized membrane protein YkvI
MKKINSATIAFTFAGSIVGAGFLSGQELWQFFGSYGKLGVVGFILALILQLALVYIILTYAKDSQTSEFDILIVKKEIKPLRYFFIFSELVFVFGVVMIMYAGSGSLLKTAFGLNDLVGSLIFATAITIVAFLGLNGITKILSATIPFLTILTLIISILALDKYGFPNLSNAQVTGKTALMPNFIVAFVLFSVHNIFCMLGVLAPIGCELKSKSSAFNGMVLSSAVLIIITLSVLLPLYSAPEFAQKDLPMLDLAKTVSAPLFYVYAVLLLVGMFGSALSHLVSVTDFVYRKSDFLNKRKYIFILPLSISAFVLSRFGFSKLISIMYPLSGYVGIIGLALIIYNFIKLKCDEKKENK